MLLLHLGPGQADEVGGYKSGPPEAHGVYGKDVQARIRGVSPSQKLSVLRKGSIVPLSASRLAESPPLPLLRSNFGWPSAVR